jgi:hypothetical protein
VKEYVEEVELDLTVLSECDDGQYLVEDADNEYLNSC